MNIENVEMIVNEVFDKCEVRENYSVGDSELIGYCLKNNEYKFICIENRCLVLKSDFMYDFKLVEVCNNDDELREFLSDL